jgi:SAM-dependent methyltransferase
MSTTPTTDSLLDFAMSAHDAANPTEVATLADRILHSGVAAFEMFSIYLGDRLGWYRSLADDGPATAAELAARTGSTERYTREWLEQQAVAGLIEVDAGEPDSRFRLSPESTEVLTDTSSMAYLAPLGRFVGAAGIQLHRLADSYRWGGGVSWAQFGSDARTAQADMNRPYYERGLAPLLAGQSQLHQRLSTVGARVADIGCGEGHSTIALSRAYPQATIIGFDIDEPSINSARCHAIEADITQANFVAADGTEMASFGPFDVIFAFECIHDLAHPVEVLNTARQALTPDGMLIVMDEATADTFKPDGDIIERLLYGWSITLCLPDSLSHHHSVGTGTLMRPSTLRRYALQAGFHNVDVLDTGEFGLWRFYCLTA